MSINSPVGPTPSLAFVDTETTGLDPFLHDAWEIAVIFREGDLDTEHTFRIEPDLSNADPKALEINRYRERTGDPRWEWQDRQNAAERLYGLLNGVVMVGSNPAFDAEMLTHLFGGYYGNPRPWHYRTVDIATLAAGYIHGAIDTSQYPGSDATPAVPYSSYGLSRAIGVEPPAKDVAHTALGDARWARDVYDAITNADAFYTTATDEQLAELTVPALSNGSQQ